MYKPKPCFDCEMPEAGGGLKVLALNASLEHGQELSNTDELVRLADMRLPVGLGFREGEDGALGTMGSIMMVLTWMGFTLPPECAAYWVGEVGQRVSEDREKRLENDATKQMAANLARNLLHYAKLLKRNPLLPKQAA